MNWSHYRPGVAQTVGRGIALLFHDCGTRRGWVVSSMPWPYSTSRKDPVPILQEDGWAPGPVWKGGQSRPHRDSVLDRPARSQSLYRLSYLTHLIIKWIPFFFFFYKNACKIVNSIYFPHLQNRLWQFLADC